MYIFDERDGFFHDIYDAGLISQVGGEDATRDTLSSMARFIAKKCKAPQKTFNAIAKSHLLLFRNCSEETALSERPFLAKELLEVAPYLDAETCEEILAAFIHVGFAADTSSLLEKMGARKLNYCESSALAVAILHNNNCKEALFLRKFIPKMAPGNDHLTIERVRSAIKQVQKPAPEVVHTANDIGGKGNSS